MNACSPPKRRDSQAKINQLVSGGWVDGNRALSVFFYINNKVLNARCEFGTD